jgi:hypothetical protein
MRVRQKRRTRIIYRFLFSQLRVQPSQPPQPPLCFPADRMAPTIAAISRTAIRILTVFI